MTRFCAAPVLNCFRRSWGQALQALRFKIWPRQHCSPLGTYRRLDAINFGRVYMCHTCPRTIIIWQLESRFALNVMNDLKPLHNRIAYICALNDAAHLFIAKQKKSCCIAGMRSRTLLKTMLSIRTGWAKKAAWSYNIRLHYCTNCFVI